MTYKIIPDDHFIQNIKAQTMEAANVYTPLTPTLVFQMLPSLEQIHGKVKSRVRS